MVKLPEQIFQSGADAGQLIKDNKIVFIGEYCILWEIDFSLFLNLYFMANTSSILLHDERFGEGEMAALIRINDWSANPLGPIESWPQTLYTTLSLLLHAQFPMFLCWGPDLISFYNDAYGSCLGHTGSQPPVLGERAETVLSSIWPIVQARIDQVQAGGGAGKSEDQPLSISRDGQLQDTYWTFNYSPVYDESGKPAGVLGLCAETTELVIMRRRVEESEIRQKLAFETAEIGTFNWDLIKPEFTFSARLAQIFGFSDTDKLNHLSFRDLIHPDDLQLRLDAHAEAIKTGRLFYEARIIRPDQSLRYIRLNGKIVFDAKNVASQLYGTAVDITEQRQQADEFEKSVLERTLTLQNINEKLKQSEERYHKMIDEIQDYAIILLDKDGIILNWNKGAERIKGYKEEEIIGKSFMIFYLPDDRASSLPEKLIREAFERGRAMHEGWRVRKDRSIFWGSIVITALHNDQNDIIGFSKVTRDLTERKLAEDQLKQYSRELEVQNKELEQFAYIASHDLQEPLRKIQTFSGLLQDSLDNAEAVDRYLGKIESSAQRMSKLIKDVLNYSRLSRIEEQFVPVDLNEILRTVLIDFELLIEQKRAVIQSDQLPVVEGISIQFNQLFYNLISNALKFSDHSPHIQITAKILTADDVAGPTGLKPGQQYVQLVFKDNGIGFEPQFSSQIFTIFQRLNHRKDYNGTGIGLALCKKIVDNHQGIILVESVVNQGTSFFIYLPLHHQALFEIPS